jgi:hypothetical protein
MLVQSRHVFEVFMGRDSGWKPQRRDGGGTTWSDAWHFHKRHMLISCMTGVIIYFLSPSLLAWVSPALLGLLISVPLSRASGSASLGRALSQVRLAAHPRGSRNARLVARRRELIATALGCPRTVCAILGAQPRRPRGAYPRQFGAPPDPRGQPDPNAFTAAQKLIDARSLDEALALAHARRACRGRRDARLLDQLAAAAGRRPPRISDLEDSRMIRRRNVLKSALALAAGQIAHGLSLAATAASPAAPPRRHGAPGQHSPSTLPGSRVRHISREQCLSGVEGHLPPAMAKLGYDQYQSIRFRGDHSLWGDAGLAFRLQFFHVGRTFSSRCTCTKSSTVRRAKSSTTPRCSNGTRAASIRTP